MVKGQGVVLERGVAIRQRQVAAIAGFGHQGRIGQAELARQGLRLQQAEGAILVRQNGFQQTAGQPQQAHRECAQRPSGRARHHSTSRSALRMGSAWVP